MKCRKCGGVVEHDDTFDTSTYDDRHIEYCVGHCLSCDTEYQWKEIYVYEGPSGLEELV